MTNTFDPAFDMPETAAEAVAVLYSWGSPHCMTFSAERAQRCAELLTDAYPEIHPANVRTANS